MKLIQITDSHLFKTGGQKLIGVDTEASLRAVIEQVAAEEDVAAILATGDISQDASPESYKLFASILDRLEAPVYWIPGNHDRSDYFHTSASDFPLGGRETIEIGNWRILMLDSVVPGYEHGHLADQELRYIEENVLDDGKFHILVLHHQPIPCGTSWLDTMQLDNSDAFMQLVSSKPSIRVVLNGHVHMATEKTLNGVRFISTPSTCFQFSPDSDDFSLDDKSPGYRRLKLHDNGDIETKVVRLQDYDMSPDASSGGY